MPLSAQSWKKNGFMFDFMFVLFQIISLPILEISSLKLTFDHARSISFKNLDLISSFSVSLAFRLHLNINCWPYLLN